MNQIFKSKKLAAATKKVSEELVKGNATKAYAWAVRNYHHFEIKDIYDLVLKKNAYNFLKYDLRVQAATQNPVTKNVSWLSFTHAITFSNAVRITCEKYPELWPAGILQMLSFYGRNSSFTDESIDESEWMVTDSTNFIKDTLNKVFDHGLAGPIFSAHIIKTGLATFQEAESSSPETRALLLASLNRFLNSPLKQKHVRRTVSQGIKLVAKDFDRN